MDEQSWINPVDCSGETAQLVGDPDEEWRLGWE